MEVGCGWDNWDIGEDTGAEGRRGGWQGSMGKVGEGGGEARAGGKGNRRSLLHDTG